MAKKKNKKKHNKIEQEMVPENVLPQNILQIGERVEEDKNIYISQQVYKEIHKFTKNKTTNESGGMLIGNVIEEFGKTNIVINSFIEAKYCEATPTTLKFTHETWDYVHKEMDKRFSNQKIVGWIHTHPDFGIFLSEYDKFIHKNFFNEQYQVAYVVDPIQKIEGFYFWIDERIEKCKGFYIFDKAGVKINVEIGKEDETKEIKDERKISFKNILIAILTIIIVILAFSTISMKEEIKILKEQQENEMAITRYLYQQIQVLSAEVKELKETLELPENNEGKGEIENE